VPRAVLASARQKLDELELATPAHGSKAQDDLFKPRELHPLLQRLAAAEPDTLSPRDAQALLYDLVQQARDATP
jgi:DNA mismatch repair protein MutS